MANVRSGKIIKPSPKLVHANSINLQGDGCTHNDPTETKDENWMFYMRRKKKCGEESPICHRCSTSGYLCTWPSMRDLVDKRTRPFEQKTSFAHIEDPTKPYNASWLRSAHEIINNCWSLYSAPNALGASRIEYELLHHFFYQFLPGLLSSAWNKAHYMEYRNHLMELIMNFQGVKYAVLASCASNISMLTSNSRYQNIALGFYSHAVKDVNFALAEISSKNLTPSDALIVAVIYLYIHDLWGGDPEFEPTAHIAGAMTLINLRLDKNGLSMSITRAIDRVALESVIYQASLLSMKDLLSPTILIDRRFVSRTETLLVNAISPSSSPILSLPLPLYRLVWDMIEFCTGPTLPGENAINRIALDLEPWEASVFEQNIAEPGSLPGEYCYICFQNLHVIAASILFGWISGKMDIPLTIKLPNLVTSHARNLLSSGTPPWQIARALAILDRQEVFESWTQSYLAAWPLFIFGLGTSSQEEAKFIRDALLRLRDRTGYRLAQRSLEELEREWGAKWKR